MNFSNIRRYHKWYLGCTFFFPLIKNMFKVPEIIISVPVIAQNFAYWEYLTGSERVDSLITSPNRKLRIVKPPKDVAVNYKYIINLEYYVGESWYKLDCYENHFILNLIIYQ